jgi:hypothetical protein
VLAIWLALLLTTALSFSLSLWLRDSSPQAIGPRDVISADGSAFTQKAVQARMTLVPNGRPPDSAIAG